MIRESRLMRRWGALAVAVTLTLAPIPGGAAGSVEASADPILTSIDAGLAPSAVVPDVVAIDFDPRVIGTSSAAAPITYTNDGTDPVTLSVPAIAGTSAGDFAVSSDTCSGSPLAAGGSCTVGVTFTPTVEGARMAEASLTVTETSAVVSVALSGIGMLPASKVGWSSARLLGPGYAWNEGLALARTSTSGTSYLHSIYARDLIGSRWASDTGPYVGVYAARSSTGSTWTTVTRLNQTTKHGDRATIAASGSSVYTAWVSLTKWVKYSPTAPRVIYFRSNSRHGSGTWSTIRRLTSTSGRVDMPRLAASGRSVYLVYTDSASGYIKLKISRDRGVTWTTKTLGATTRAVRDGRLGTPVVAVAGSTVAVAWVSSSAGAVKMRVSTNSGSSWGGTKTIGSGADLGTYISIAARGSRLAVAWTDGDHAVVRIRSGSTWLPSRIVRAAAGPITYSWMGTPAVSLAGTSLVGIAFAACRAACLEADPEDALRVDGLWRESSDNGASWARHQVVFAASDPATLAPYSYLPSVLWPASGTRYVSFNRYDWGMDMYRIQVRTGTGTP